MRTRTLEKMINQINDFENTKKVKPPALRNLYCSPSDVAVCMAQNERIDKSSFLLGFLLMLFFFTVVNVLLLDSFVNKAYQQYGQADYVYFINDMAVHVFMLRLFAPEYGLANSAFSCGFLVFRL